MSERQICDSNTGPCKFDQSGEPMWYQREFEGLSKPASQKQASVDTTGGTPGQLERVEYTKPTAADQLQHRRGQDQRQDHQRGPQDRGHHPQGQQVAPDARAQHRQRQEIHPPQDNPQQHVDRRQGDRDQAHIPPERQQAIDAWKARQAAQEQAHQRTVPGQQRRDQTDQRQVRIDDGRRHLEVDGRRRPEADVRRHPDGTPVVRRPRVEAPLDPRQQLDPRQLTDRNAAEQQRLAELQRRRHDQPGNRQTEQLEQQIRRQLESSGGRNVDQNLIRQLEQARRQQQYRDQRADQGLNWTDIQRQRQFLDAQRDYGRGGQIDPYLLQQLLRNAQRGGRYDDYAYRQPYRPGGSDYYDPRYDQRYSYDPRYAYDPRYDQYDRYPPYRPGYDDYARNDWDPRCWDPYGRDPYGRDPYGRDRFDPYGRDRWGRGGNDIGRQLAASIIPIILGQVFNQIDNRNHHRGGYDRYGYDPYSGRYGGYDPYNRYGGHRGGYPCRGGYQSFARAGNNPLGMIMNMFRI